MYSAVGDSLTRNGLIPEIERVYEGEDHDSVGYVALAHGLVHLFSSPDPSLFPCAEVME